MPEFSDFIVYADESGDHGMVNVDPSYPIFALVFYVVNKNEYSLKTIPSVQKFKFEMFGHDAVILHENEIRKSKGDFTVLMGPESFRKTFYDKLNEVIKDAPASIFASVIRKDLLREKYANPWNPYQIALHFCMEKLHALLKKENQKGKTIHVIFESRGQKEDKDLELEFRKIADNDGHWGYRKDNFKLFDFQPIFVSKMANAPGLQLADLIVRPIGLSQLRPDQPNRAFEIIKPQLQGIKCFPAL